ncbi:spermidine/putrescine ABC transporter permease [Clostridia bacterium]|nr:spermidine/putrescine ABC transporter permease [Clostridia bacterium]
MKSKAPAYPYLLWMLIFTIIPLVMVVYYAVTDSSGQFSLQAFADSFFYKDVFLRSMWISLLSTIICLLIAYPLSYMMSKAKKSSRNILVMLLMLPMWMNFILRIYAWVLLLQNDGLVDLAIKFVGLDTPLLGNSGAVVLGMVYNFLPFMVLPIYTVMLKIDGNLIEAAQDLGANPVRVFSKVVFPLSVPGIISGITMVFVPTASTFLVAQYLGGTGDKMIGDVIENIFQRDKNVGSALSLALMVIILIFIIVMNKFGDEEAAVA